jgi:hypothetical protein
MSRPASMSDEPVDGLTDGLLLSLWRIEPVIRTLDRVKVASSLRGRGLLGDLVRHVAVPISMDHEGGNVARHDGPIGTISLHLLEEHPAKPKLAVDQQEALTMELLLLSGAEVLQTPGQLRLNETSGVGNGCRTPLTLPPTSSTCGAALIAVSGSPRCFHRSSKLPSHRTGTARLMVMKSVAPIWQRLGISCSPGGSSRGTRGGAVRSSSVRSAAPSLIWPAGDTLPSAVMSH